MGIFSEADHHPFVHQEREMVADETRGGSGREPWREERAGHDYALPRDPDRGLFIRDEAA